MLSQGLWGYLTLLALVIELVLAAFAFAFVKRVRERESNPVSEEIGAAKVVMHKVRKREPLSPDELAYAKQVIADHRTLMLYALPGAIFTIGCFYVFGSLEQLHGARPSERTFLGVIPMLTSASLTLRLLSVAKLKGRLPGAPAQQAAPAGSTARW